MASAIRLIQYISYECRRLLILLYINSTREILTRSSSYRREGWRTGNRSINRQNTNNGRLQLTQDQDQLNSHEYEDLYVRKSKKNVNSNIKDLYMISSCVYIVFGSVQRSHANKRCNAKLTCNAAVSTYTYLIHSILGDDLDAAQCVPYVHKHDAYRPQGSNSQDSYKRVYPDSSSCYLQLQAKIYTQDREVNAHNIHAQYLNIITLYIID